jgi:hypothetical protein
MSYTAYSSTSYLVLANEAGTEITNLHSGFTEWLQGDDSNLLREQIEKASASSDDAATVVKATDRILSEYFGADR